MRHSFRVRRLSFALALPLLGSGCLSLGHGYEPGPSANAVIVAEPAAASAGPAVPDQPPEEPHSDALLAAARLVANDGRPGHVVIPAGERWYGRGCGAVGLATPRDPLYEPGVRRDVGGYAESRSWVFVGLALGGGGIAPALFAGPCGTPWMEDVTGARLARLPAEVSGRDTSLTFTTARAAAPAGSGGGGVATGVVGAVIEHFLPRGGRRDDAPRTAQPRAASSEGQSAPAKPEPEKTEPSRREPARERPSARSARPR